MELGVVPVVLCRLPTTTIVRKIVIKTIQIYKIMKFCPIPPQFLFDIISGFNKLCGDGSAKRIYKSVIIKDVN